MIADLLNVAMTVFGAGVLLVSAGAVVLLDAVWRQDDA